jgi:lipoprotein-anchoring transpeptidase ErfK/SrfK
MDDARADLADRWAPEIMSIAEGSLRSGLESERHEESQLLCFRDFRGTAEYFRLAEEGARLAASVGLQRKEEACQQAQAALDSTTVYLAAVEDVANQMPFPDIERIRLQQARNHSAEAAVFIANGEYAEAGELARLAATEAEMAVSRAMPLASRFIAADQVRQWQRWIDETVAWSRTHGSRAVVINKERNILRLYESGKLVRTYNADMGKNRLNRKIRAGDQATPEGRYRITAKKGRGQSRYFMALLLDYPNAEDRQRLEQAKRRGEISRGAGLGNQIEIHGEGGRGGDWTLGCVALTNNDIRELFSKVSVGTPVTIVGGEGQGGIFSNLARASAAGQFSRKL